MPPRKKKPAAGSVGLDAQAVAADAKPGEVAKLEKQIAADGGAALASYKEPFGGHWVVFASLPLEKVEPTPYQRELSKTHADRLAQVIPKVGMFLDPLIAVRSGEVYWTPNGMHRLAAMKALGAKAVIALVVPDERIAYRILALNTEKAHNLRDKSLEVIRMARGLADVSNEKESSYAFEFEEPSYLTIGMCYEENGRFSGGAYLPVVKRCDAFLDEPISAALEEREARAKKLLHLDEAVNGVVQKLKDAGLKSSYLKPFVVARINPLRFSKSEPPPIDEVLTAMRDKAAKFNVDKVRQQDLMGASGPPPEE